MPVQNSKVDSTGLIYFSKLVVPAYWLGAIATSKDVLQNKPWSLSKICKPPCFVFRQCSLWWCMLGVHLTLNLFRSVLFQDPLSGLSSCLKGDDQYHGSQRAKTVCSLSVPLALSCINNTIHVVSKGKKLLCCTVMLPVPMYGL